MNETQGDRYGKANCLPSPKCGNQLARANWAVISTLKRGETLGTRLVLHSLSVKMRSISIPGTKSAPFPAGLT
ncbi:hypothetical protein KCP77_10300 [Salmonella enterica subsp. enterica]|nr:hypothetical protein KCP77_10300 [Salmonella enterica subsp. enterica]